MKILKNMKVISKSIVQCNVHNNGVIFYSSNEHLICSFTWSTVRLGWGNIVSAGYKLSRGNTGESCCSSICLASPFGLVTLLDIVVYTSRSQKLLHF